MANKMNETMDEWKSNIEATKKAKFLREWEQLKFQTKTMEREKMSQTYSKHGDRKYYSELEELEMSINEELKNERIKIDQHLGKIKSKVKIFQGQLKNVKPTPEFVEKLREVMEDIESTITNFKQQQRKMFESLLTEENNTNHEIEIIQARIETISSTSTVSGATKSKVVKQSQQSNLPPEVKAFEKYLSQHGAQGGWDDYDHSTFLKIRNRLKGKPSFMRMAADNIPGRRFEDVKEHEEWYRKFVELRDAKKNAILDWKLKKEREHVESAAISETDKDETSEKITREKEKREEIEREQKKKELEEWKARKAEQARLEMEEIERNELRKKKMKEKEQMKMNDIRDAARERLRTKKEEQDRERWRMETEEEEIRAIKGEQAQMEIARFQTRDQVTMQQKQIERRRKEHEEKRKKERIQRARSSIKVESDRNRLYQPTDAWIQRNKQLDDKTGNTDVISMPHRAIPSWRQGL